MLDSLKTQAEVMAGIPDGGTRVAALIILGFVVAVLVLLLYLKMKDVDEKAGM